MYEYDNCTVARCSTEIFKWFHSVWFLNDFKIYFLTCSFVIKVFLVKISVVACVIGYMRYFGNYVFGQICISFSDFLIFMLSINLVLIFFHTSLVLILSYMMLLVSINNFLHNSRFGQRTNITQFIISITSNLSQNPPHNLTTSRFR